MTVTPEAIGGLVFGISAAGVTAFREWRASNHRHEVRKRLERLETSCRYPYCGHMCTDEEVKKWEEVKQNGE